MISIREKCPHADIAYPCNAVLRVYNHILTFTKLATYSASVVKSNFGKFGSINPFISPGYAPAIL